eukprot:scaffold167267_cov17-Prasinocladus_malaysianus.AAC.1
MSCLPVEGCKIFNMRHINMLAIMKLNVKNDPHQYVPPPPTITFKSQRASAQILDLISLPHVLHCIDNS